MYSSYRNTYHKTTLTLHYCINEMELYKAKFFLGFLALCKSVEKFECFNTSAILIIAYFPLFF